MQFIVKKRAWLVSKSLVEWILSKKSGGHLRTTFSLSGYYDPESENYFANISAKTRKKSKLYFWSSLRSNGVPDYEKNQRSKISCYCPFKHFYGHGYNICLLLSIQQISNLRFFAYWSPMKINNFVECMKS